jgi:FkbH-like protein
LWGGVVGEVGPAGIELGPDGTGRSFQLFQQYLKHLQERGLLLVVVSRNEESDVLDVFENHPEMILRPDDIVAWRVNWDRKPENLRELAEELNLGIDSFVFLDDDPAVRMEVTARVPEVHVLPLPEDPADYCEMLARTWLFDGAEATEEDAARTRMMQEEGRRQRERKSAASLEQYLASLDLKVEVTEPTEHEWSRVAQLTQRTNQFTLALKQRTVEEVRALAAASPVLALRASDRFGGYGLVGVAILREGEQTQVWEIDTLLMSCRVLGRGVEDAFIYGIGRVAVQHGARMLAAPYVEGPRNRQILDFLARSGFRETEPRVWTRSLDPMLPLPGHLDFHLSCGDLNQTVSAKVGQRLNQAVLAAS